MIVNPLEELLNEEYIYDKEFLRTGSEFDTARQLDKQLEEIFEQNRKDY